MSEPGFETRKPDRASALDTCCGVPETFLHFAETSFFLAREGISFQLVLVGEAASGLPATSRASALGTQRSRPALHWHL